MISKFSGEYGFLSNFYETVITYENINYWHSEGAYQAAKTDNLSEKLKIADERNPGKAKKLGRRCSIRSGWESIKDEIMYQIVLAKFVQNLELRQKLIDTENVHLEEGNTWHDNHFGVCHCTKCGSVGQNKLGLILMKVREELK